MAQLVLGNTGDYMGFCVFGFAFHTAPKLGGVIGFELNILLQDYVGKIGTAFIVSLLFYCLHCFAF